MNGSPLAVKRLIVGLIALSCVGIAAGMWFFAEDPEKSPVTALTMRLGLMLGAIWLALPAKGESIAWQRAIPIGVVIAVVCVRGGRYLLYAIPIALVVGIVVAFVRPRSNRQRPRR